MTIHYLVYDYDDRLVDVFETEDSANATADHLEECPCECGRRGYYKECDCDDPRNHLDENGNPE